MTLLHGRTPPVSDGGRGISLARALRDTAADSAVPDDAFARATTRGR